MEIASFNLDGDADAVEFCPYTAFHQILAAATYTLQQDGDLAVRSGSLSLFSVVTSGLKMLDRVDASGIFDIKWNPISAIARSPLLAQATSDGFLTLYALHPIEFSLSEVCKEMVKSSMCLCVDWGGSGYSVAAGLSDGWVSALALREDRLQITHSWAAHKYETWTVSFSACHPQLLYTGSDDCSFGCWDLRQPASSPAVFQNAKSHGMGVCSIAQCPFEPDTLVTGCYDEGLRVWDVRLVSKPVAQTCVSLGGGVWRVKSHPLINGLVLAACMHGGVAVVKIDGENAAVLEKYGGHQSMAYGVDWQRGGDGVGADGGGLLVASCSFYDRLLRIWKPHCLLE